MSIALIISTHGLSAKYMLNTVEMILGKQKNVECVDFVSGEGSDDLFKKYNLCISNLSINHGLIFLVDIWGGSPFNTASRIAINNINIEVISGVNIPMLIEIFMSRNEIISLKKISLKAIKTGINGIKTLKYLKLLNKKETTSIIRNKINTNKNKNYMNIVLARIDDRLIHGQVVTSWTKETKINRIIVISDEVDADKNRKNLLIQVAPPGITSHVINIAKSIRVFNNPKYANDRVMLLFNNPSDVLSVIEKGIKIKSINIGGMSYNKNKIQINNAISVDKKDIIAFKKLNKLGIELEVRKVYKDTSLNLINLIKNLSIY
ncbi:MAG: PTS mannose transporter subunit IIAB [Candidatus Makana argininalis]